MAIPRPRLVHPRLGPLRAALESLGLPPVVRCELLTAPWVHANYRLGFDPTSGLGDLLLRRRVADPGQDSFAHELAALAALRGSDLPVVRSYRILPRGTLPWPAVLSDLLPGEQGFRILRKQPAHASAICRATGEVVGRLARERRPTWGTEVDGERFVPRRATWREEWTDLAWGWWDRARAAQTELGPLGQAVWAALRDRLPALDSAEQWALVHGDLHPSNLLFAQSAPQAGPVLCGIVDWEGALVGDPLLEWALLVELPDPTLGHVLAGLGEDAVRALLDDAAALERLEVYRLGRAIRRLAYGAMHLFRGDGGVRRSYALEYGRVVCREALERPVGEKLAAALACGTAGEVVQKVPAPRIHRVIWQAVEALGYRPAVGATERALALSAALAAVFCDEGHHDLGRELVRRVGPQRHLVGAAPVEDRAALVDDLVRLVAGRPDRAVALALVALAVEGLERLGPDPRHWPVHDGRLRSLEVLVRQLHQHAPAPREAPARLAHAVLALASLQALAPRLPDLDLAPAEEAARLAWEDLTLFGQAPEGAVEPAEVRARWLAEPDPERPMVPLLLWALERATGGLPADPPRILGALGLAADPSPPEPAPTGAPPAGPSTA